MIKSNLPDGPSEESKRIDRQIREQHLGAKPTARPVKPPFRHVITFDWFREFTLLERLQIALGYGLNVLIRIPTAHKPGEVGVLVIGETTRCETVSQYAREKMQAALEEQYGPQLPKPEGPDK